MIKTQLLDKIQSKNAVVGIVGLGYVGLPLAVEVATEGFGVIGVDVNPATVDRVNSGSSHVGDVSSAYLFYYRGNGFPWIRTAGS